MKSSFTAKIAKREDVTGDLFKLWLDLGENRKNFSFKAGQYLTIGLLDGEGNWILDSFGKKAQRPYSIVSAPYEERIELLVELLPKDQGGNLTPLLYKLKEGDSVEVLPRAKGCFTFEPKYKNQVMVATVTGIAPFVSMIREYFHARGSAVNNFFILHGASYSDEFVYDGELFEREESFYLFGGQDVRLNFEYEPSVSRSNESRNFGWVSHGGMTGRLNTIIEDQLDWWELKSTADKDDTIIYVCGHPGMIKSVKACLSPAGWNIKEERFWKG